MNSESVIVPILGLLSFVGVIVGLLYFQWYERHQRLWRARLEAIRQAASLPETKCHRASNVAMRGRTHGATA